MLASNVLIPSNILIRSYVLSEPHNCTKQSYNLSKRKNQESLQQKFIMSVVKIHIIHNTYECRKAHVISSICDRIGWKFLKLLTNYVTNLANLSEFVTKQISGKVKL